MKKQIKKLVLIAGTGHCGSTLLDLILSSHSKAFGLGELWSLGNDLRYFNKEIPFCNINGFEDDFWTDFRINSTKDYFTRAGKIRKRVESWLPSISWKRKLYEYLFDQTEGEILIDSSKNPIWIGDSIKKLKRSGIEVFLIYLTRDGRAVINSYLRKYPERGIERITNRWLSKIKEFKELYESYDGSKMVVSYEQLTIDPINTVKSICELVDIEYEQTMMEFWKHDHHQIGGNSGTKSLILSTKNRELNGLLSARKARYYKIHPLEIKPDMRWKAEYSNDELALVESKISHINLHYGV